MKLLAIQQLGVYYGKVQALHHIELSVEQGQIVTVVGPNGAGKTTLLHAIMGLLPSEGIWHFEGIRYNHPTVEQMVAKGVGLVPEKRCLFSEMSVEDNLRLGAFYRHRQGIKTVMQDLRQVYEQFPRLEERRHQMAGTLSGGERQMLALGRALMGHPKLLLLDEPSLGLAPLIVRDIFRMIAQLKAKGFAILLIEQNARAAMTIADHAYVLEMGEIKLQGAAQTLIQDPRVIEAYLGLGGKHQAVLSS